MFQFHGKQKAARVNRGRRFVAIVISQVSIQPRCTRYESLEIAGHDHAVTVDRFYGRIWPHPALQKLDIVQVQGAEYDFDVGYSPAVPSDFERQGIGAADKIFCPGHHGEPAPA